MRGGISRVGCLLTMFGIDRKAQRNRRGFRRLQTAIWEVGYLVMVLLINVRLSQ